jgi:nucleoside-diphosphate-sugar epimerase
VDRFLVTGVSGPIGAVLLPSLESRAARIVRLVRGLGKEPRPDVAVRNAAFCARNNVRLIFF